MIPYYIRCSNIFDEIIIKNWSLLGKLFTFVTLELSFSMCGRECDDIISCRPFGLALCASFSLAMMPF
jgi:hypothetical protein